MYINNNVKKTQENITLMIDVVFYIIYCESDCVKVTVLANSEYITTVIRQKKT